MEIATIAFEWFLVGWFAFRMLGAILNATPPKEPVDHPSPSFCAGLAVANAIFAFLVVVLF